MTTGEQPDIVAERAELAALATKLAATDDIEQYRGKTGRRYTNPSTTSGYKDITVLPELVGLPLSNLILAYVAGLQPRSIRVSDGIIDCMASPGRVTIMVDAKDIVQEITMEVSVAYGAGWDIQQATNQLRNSQTVTLQPAPRGIMDSRAILNADLS